MSQEIRVTPDTPNAEMRAAIAEARSGEGLTTGADLKELLSRLLTKRERM